MSERAPHLLSGARHFFGSSCGSIQSVFLLGGVPLSAYLLGAGVGGGGLVRGRPLRGRVWTRTPQGTSRQPLQADASCAAPSRPAARAAPRGSAHHPNAPLAPRLEGSPRPGTERRVMQAGASAALEAAGGAGPCGFCHLLRRRAGRAELPKGRADLPWVRRGGGLWPVPQGGRLLPSGDLRDCSKHHHLPTARAPSVPVPVPSGPRRCGGWWEGAVQVRVGIGSSVLQRATLQSPPGQTCWFGVKRLQKCVCARAHACLSGVSDPSRRLE